MISRARIGAAALLLLLPGPASAQDIMPYCRDGTFRWGVGPTIVPADDFWDHFGGRAQAMFCSAGHDSTKKFPFSYGVNVGGTYLLVDDSVRIPSATEIRATGALSVSIYEPEEEAPDTLHPDQLPGFDGGGFDLGFLEVGGTAAYEASADRREQHLAFGFEGRYASNAPGWGMWVPSIVVRYEWVEPTASDAREVAGIADADDDHSRLTLRGYLNLRPGYLLQELSAFRLEIDASLFRASGLEDVLEQAGWDSGEYLAATLGFERRIDIGPLAITSIYLGYAAGQLPTDFEGRDAFSGGITLAVGN